MTPMDFSMIFCVGSIVLGVFAWLMGIWAIRKYKPWKMTFSYLFCALALLLPLFEVKNRALGGDFAAIEDTIRAVVFAGIVMLVVVVINTFLRIWIPNKIKLLPLYVFLFAAGVEVLQYFEIVKILGVEDNTFLRILLGSTFDPKDIVCYGVGCFGIFLVERIERKEKTS